MNIKQTIFSLLIPLFFVFTNTPLFSQEHSDEVSPLLLWSYASLEEVKSLIGKEEALTVAYKQLLKDAQSAMEIQRISVVDKTGPAPSGNPHDYVSIGIYWWPNPKKKDGLPYIRRDGERNPESGNETFDGARTNQLQRAIQTLSLAWYFSEEEQYAEQAIRLLKIFFIDPETFMNPHLDYAQGVPGRYSGRGVGIIETANWIHLPDSFALLKSSKGWNEVMENGLRTWISEYLQWLLNSPNGMSCRMNMNNIGIWYDCQILTWSLFLNQKESALKYYREVALPRAMKLIQPNGQIPSELRRTRSWSYTVYALQALCNLSLLSQHLGEHLATHTGSSGASLQEAIRYPYNYLSKPNSWPHKQIGKDLGKLNFDVAFFALQQYGEEAFPNLRDYLKNSIPQNARIRLLHGSLK